MKAGPVASTPSLIRALSRRLGVGRFVLHALIEPAQRFERLRLPNRNRVVEAHDLQLEVFPPRRNRIGEALYRHGTWEPPVTAAALDLLQPGMTIVDVGADIGYYTALFARHAAPGRVFAFEPIPAARELLIANLKRNQCDNARVSPHALGRRDGEAVLRAPLDLSRIDPEAGTAGPGDITVTVRRYDDLAPQLGIEQPDLVKIDVEGAEHDVLRGMEATVREHRPVFLLETHGSMLPSFGSSKAEILSWFSERGYGWTVIDGDRADGPGTTTFIFRPDPS